MAEFILKDWYGKEQTFDKETIYVQGKDGELMPFTNGTGSSESEEMVYYRGLAESLMLRKSEYLSGDATRMNLKGFVSSDGNTLSNLVNYSFAGFKNVEAMSFTDVILIGENAFYGCTALKIIDITVPKTIPSVSGFPECLNGCPNIEAVIFRESGGGLEVAGLPLNNGSNDEFYIYVPAAYYDAVTENLSSYTVPKSRYRKLEDYPEVDKWYETNT